METNSGGIYMILTVLGSCANQISSREGVALLMEKGNDNLLIDCGPGIVAAFGRCNRKTSDVNNLLLTHVHGDHTAGFPYFVWNRNFECMGSTPPEDLHVYGEHETIELVQFTLGHCYPELTFPFKVIYHEIEVDSAVCCDEIKITCVRANHAVPCISCVIESNSSKIVYSSDTLYNNALSKYSSEADILIHEGIMVSSMEELANRVKNSTASSAGKFASAISAKQLLLVHIALGLLGKETVLLEEARAHYHGPISIPYDGSVYLV